MLQIRLSDGEIAALKRIARSEHLHPSTWARQQLLRVLEARQELMTPRSSGETD